MNYKIITIKFAFATLVCLLVLGCAAKNENLDGREVLRIEARIKKTLQEIEESRANKRIEPLVAILLDKSQILFHTRARAAKALGEIKDARAVEPLIAVLNDEDLTVRAMATEGLGEIKDARAVEPLIAVLNDENVGLRARAAKALGEIKDARAVEPLIAVLKDQAERQSVRARAAKALGEIKDAGAVGPLIAVLEDKNSRVLITISQVKTSVLQEATKALGKIGTPALEPLTAALQDENPLIRARAAGALGEIKDARAVELLMAALKDKDSRVLQEATKALGKIGTPALELLTAALQDENPLIRARAAGALGETKDIRAVEPLMAALRDKNLLVRARAAKALGQIKDIRADEPLMAALKDKSRLVRGSAERALKEIKEAQAVRPPAAGVIGNSSTSGIEPEQSEEQKSGLSEIKSAEGEETEGVKEGMTFAGQPESSEKKEGGFYQVDGKLKPFEIKIGKRTYDKPSVLVTINGKTQRRLAIDSGAPGVIIHQGIAESANLKLIGRDKMEGIGETLGVHTVDVVLIDTLEIGGLKINNVPARVMMGSRRAGVVGLPAIGRFGLVELDFKKRKLRFTPYDQIISKRRYPAKGEVRVPFLKNSSRHIIVDAQLNDNPCKALVDTGAMVTLISSSFLERIGVGIRPPTDSRENPNRLSGFSGSTINWWVIGSEVRLKIGEKKLPVVPYHRDRNRIGESLALDRLRDIFSVDMLLGMSHLRNFSLTVDYRNDLVTMKSAD